ncbi:hypothetical protein [Candidatus Uabimicrobium amorphum]|uniref:Uncharacterized protein n=1 Tax=Uabimicrobium amorphum TaxID=2596890 RepID=A0A5S9F6F1_UABAM|nr:hypothetical protein [Candidatus Uabimicrobium amorphum]BBM86202.1 hypothetical protein UABAM_04588 [Candidatus Uabimicrobium amorphum]
MSEYDKLLELCSDAEQLQDFLDSMRLCMDTKRLHELFHNIERLFLFESSLARKRQAPLRHFLCSFLHKGKFVTEITQLFIATSFAVQNSKLWCEVEDSAQLPNNLRVWIQAIKLKNA